MSMTQKENSLNATDVQLTELEKNLFNEKFANLATSVDHLQVMRHPSELCMSEIPSIIKFKVINPPVFEKVFPRHRKSQELTKPDQLKIIICDPFYEETEEDSFLGEGEDRDKYEGREDEEEEEGLMAKLPDLIEEESVEAAPAEEIVILQHKKGDSEAEDLSSLEEEEEKPLVKAVEIKQEEKTEDALVKAEGKPRVRVKPIDEYKNTYIRITLRPSRHFFSLDERSSTVPRNSYEGQIAEADNKHYEFLTSARGRMRRRNEAETQTQLRLLKSRDVNTIRVSKSSEGAFVSTFLMWKTFQDTESEGFSIRSLGDEPQSETGTIEEKKLDHILSLSSFQLAMMKVTRILAGDVYGDVQCRYRNMTKPDPFAEKVEFKYRLEVLFAFRQESLKDQKRKAVSDIKFCPNNGDILAIGYGIFSWSGMNLSDTGLCCIWNIKNPVNPERVYEYDWPVVAVSFSTSSPQLLAIGLYDGSVEVLDISNYDDPPVAVSVRTEQASVEPITAIEWLPVEKEGTENGGKEVQPFMALSQDGRVTKYRLINSTKLLSFRLMELERVQGNPEGIHKPRLQELRIQSNRMPQGLNLVLHPIHRDIYFILTDEGCLHKCSTNNPHQHLEVFQTHHASVSCMDFSPFSPKLFLTCGNDWCIRIWLEGIHKPLITLKNEAAPINSAAWSLTHPTVIVSNSRSHIQIWDIRRDLLKPCSLKVLEKSYFTLFKIAPCGRSLIIGNERGNAFMLAFEDMPFPSHFQYEDLQETIYKAVANDADLLEQVKYLGHFGYKHKGHF